MRGMPIPGQSGFLFEGGIFYEYILRRSGDQFFNDEVDGCLCVGLGVRALYAREEVQVASEVDALVRHLLLAGACRVTALTLLLSDHCIHLRRREKSLYFSHISQDLGAFEWFLLFSSRVKVTFRDVVLGNLTATLLIGKPA